MGLGLLVLVVREAQIDAPAMDVEDLPQVASAHGRALQVPAGPAAPPGGVPGGVGGFGGPGGLPQGEIARVALVRLDVVVDLGLVLGGGQILHPLVGQRPVVAQRAHVEVDVAALADVGVPGVQQALDEVDHLRDVPGGARLVGGGSHAQGPVGGVELALVALGPSPPLHGRVGGGRLGEDLVVDIGDVADEHDPLPGALQPAAQHVEGDGRAHMADVGRALDGGAAQVDGDRSGGDGGSQGHDGARGGVVQAQVRCRALGAVVAHEGKPSR